MSNKNQPFCKPCIDQLSHRYFATLFFLVGHKVVCVCVFFFRETLKMFTHGYSIYTQYANGHCLYVLYSSLMYVRCRFLFFYRGHTILDVDTYWVWELWFCVCECEIVREWRFSGRVSLDVYELCYVNFFDIVMKWCSDFSCLRSQQMSTTSSLSLTYLRYLGQKFAAFLCISSSVFFFEFSLLKLLLYSHSEYFNSQWPCLIIFSTLFFPRIIALTFTNSSWMPDDLGR